MAFNRIARATFALLMGYTFIGGTTVQIYDDADVTGGHTAGNPHSLAEMAASTDPNVAASVLDSGFNYKTYRILQNVRHGSNTGGQTNTTTWTDTDAVINFDNSKTLSYGTVGGSANVTNWGTKVGAGNKASGRNGVTAYFGLATTIRGNFNFYGCELIQGTGTAAFQFLPASGGGNIVNSIIGHRGTGTTATIALGSAAAVLNNAYNVDLWGNINSANFGLVTGINCTTAERISIAINAAGYFIRSSQSTMAVKDLLFFGTPSVADMVCTGSSGITWTLVDMGWSGNAPKFGNMTTAAGNITEYRSGDVKAGDGNGLDSSGVAAKLTDALTNVIFNTTTDAMGRVSFGSGLTMNAVPVLDHYGTAANYLTRPRSPFLMEAGAQRYYFNWPTDANGNFEDMADVIPSRGAAGNPTTYVERVAP